MKNNMGRDLLIPKEDWVDASELFGDVDEPSSKIPTHKVVVKANERILELFKPKNKIAVVSRCTSSRPYIKSQKWKEINKQVGDACDLIVVSSAGVIPQEFWDCYPFCTYDDITPPDKFWMDYVENSLVKFFENNKYDLIVFYMTPNCHHRRKGILDRVIKRIDTKCVILPTIDVYNEARKENFKPFSRMFPECGHQCIDELKSVVFGGDVCEKES